MCEKERKSDVISSSHSDHCSKHVYVRCTTKKDFYFKMYREKLKWLSTHYRFILGRFVLRRRLHCLLKNKISEKARAFNTWKQPDQSSSDRRLQRKAIFWQACSKCWKMFAQIYHNVCRCYVSQLKTFLREGVKIYYCFCVSRLADKRLPTACCQRKSESREKVDFLSFVTIPVLGSILLINFLLKEKTNRYKLSGLCLSHCLLSTCIFRFPHPPN